MASDWQLLAEKILSEAKSLGAEQAEVNVSEQQGLSLNVRQGQVENIEHQADRAIAITVYINQASGSVSTSLTKPDAIQQAVEKAVFIAKQTSPDPCAGLAEKNELAFHYPELSLYYPWNIHVNEAIELAKNCEALALNHDKRISNSEGASVNRQEGDFLYANSQGFLGGYKTSIHGMSCALIAEADGQMEQNYDYTQARDPAKLWDIKKLALSAAENTVQRLGAKKLSSRKTPVIYIPKLARGIIKHLASAMSGYAIYRDSSFLKGKIGEKIFPEHIHVEENPLIEAALGSAPFDSEGVKTKAMNWIEHGTLCHYLLDSYTARQLKMQNNGHAGGNYNVFIESKERYEFDELIKKMHQGLIVTELMGQGVNIVTGDYSRGAFGFWVENGEIQYPVHEITLAGNLAEMFQNIIAIGNDIDERGSIQTGSLLIKSMTIAGQ